MSHAAIEDYLSELMTADAPAATALPTALPAAVPAAPPMPPMPTAPATPVAPAPAPPPAHPPALSAFLREATAAAADAKVPARRAHERSSRWLRFRVGGQPFAVEVLKVQEVLRVPEIVPVRGAPDAVVGLMNLRGQLVAVLDLATRLALPPAARAERAEDARVVVLEEHGHCLGVHVDAVADVVTLTDAAIETVDGPLLGAAGDILRGVARVEGSTVVLLDARAVLED